MFWPPFWVRTAGPIHWPPLSWVEVTSTWEYWSLAYVSPVRMSPARPLLDPITAWEEIDKPPSVIAVQFAPRLPFVLLKSSEPDVAELVVQATAMLVTLAEATVPEALEAVQVWPEGLVFTVTL